MISSLRKKYAAFINQAVEWLNRSSYSITKSPELIIEQHEESAVIQLSEALYLRDWPYRAGSRKRIDILATVQETVSLPNSLCTRSTTRVNYFRVDGQTAVPTEMVHYDFVVPLQGKHPICHAQIAGELLDESEWPDTFRRIRKVDRDRVGERGQNVRIPSAFVNLPGLIMILSSDHMKEDDWREFSQLCLQHCTGLPCMTGPAEMAKMIRSYGLCVWAWYEFLKPS